MAAPIYIPAKRNPWEAMLPQMLQNMMMQSMQQRLATQQATQAQETRRGELGEQMGIRMQEQGRSPLTDQEVQGGIEGSVRSPYTGKTYGPRPQQQVGQVMVGGVPHSIIKDPVGGGITLKQVTKPTALTFDERKELETHKSGLKPPSTALTFEQRKVLKAIGPPKAPKPGVNYLLKDRSMVTSFDGGRTFRDEAGKGIKMPFDAVRINATVTGQELGMMRAQDQVPKGEAAAEGIEGMKVGEGGTGPYSMFAAAIDKFFGGLGADKLFGKKGFFPETQENRQVLKQIKQLGKAALMNSSRGAIWEQQKIDELFPNPDNLFTNPRTEAKKFTTLRNTLLQEKTFNNSAILSSVTPKEVSDLRKANIDIDRLLSLIGTSEPDRGGPQVGVVEGGYTFKGGDPANPKSWQKAK